MGRSTCNPWMPIKGRPFDIFAATNDQDSDRYPEATCAGSRFTDRAACAL